MYFFKQRAVTYLGFLSYHLWSNRILHLSHQCSIRLSHLILFFYLLALASPVWAMNDDDGETIPLCPFKTRSPVNLLNNTITLEIDNQEIVFPLTSVSTYQYSTSGSISDYNRLPNGSAWVEAIKNWASNSYASPAKKYHFVRNNTTYALPGVYSLSDAPRYPYRLEFRWKDDRSTHMTVLTAIPFFMAGQVRKPLNEITFQVPHMETILSTRQNNDTSLYYDGRTLYNPEIIQNVSYECPAVRGINGLENSRSLGTREKYLTTGRELGCLALKTTTNPEEGAFLTGIYRSLERQEIDSPFIYSNGQGLFMTRHIKTICGIGIDDGIDYIFEYILPTAHELKLKEGCRLLSAAQSQPGFLPQGLYEWKCDWWVGTDNTFTTIAEQSYQIQPPVQNTTCFKDVIFDQSVSNAQTIKSICHSSYLPNSLISLDFSREFVKEDAGGLGQLLLKLTNLSYLNLAEQKPHYFSHSYGYADVNNFSSLKKLTNLTHLNLAGNILVAAGIDMNIAFSFPQLTYLNILDVKLKMPQPSIIGVHTNLKELHAPLSFASHCPNLTFLAGREVTDETLGTIGQGCPKLINLSVGKRSDIKQAGIENIGKYFTNLTDLLLDDCHIDDSEVPSIVKWLTHLTSLSITSYSTISTQGVIKIANNFTKLSTLDLMVSPNFQKVGDIQSFTQQLNPQRTLRMNLFIYVLDSQEIGALQLLKNRLPNLNIAYQMMTIKDGGASRSSTGSVNKI